jgi:hypothetical protein
MMATQTQTTEAGAQTLTLDPPAPLQTVEAAQASGLVPLKDEQKSQLDEKVESFVARSRSSTPRPTANC